MDRLAPVPDAQHLRLEALAVALLAGGIDVFEEIHLQLFIPVPFAALAASVGGIEGEVPWRQTAAQGFPLGGEQGADLVEGLQVGDGVGARRPADRLLVDEPYALHMFESLDGLELSHRERLDTKGAGGGPVQRLFDERAFARSRDAGDADQHVERNADYEILEIVLGRAGDAQDFAVARAPGLRQGNAGLSAQVPGGERGRVGEELFAWRRADDVPALLARTGSHFDDVVCGLNHRRIVLHHDDGVAMIGEIAKDPGQGVRVAGMQADRRFIQYVECTHQTGAQLVGQCNALCFSTGQGFRLPRQREVAQSYTE